MPDTLVFIGDGAFAENQLTSIKLPESLVEIWDYAFYDNKLNQLSIPNSLTKLGKSAFMNNEITTLNLSNTLTSISSEAFKDNKITNLKIPDSVIDIENKAFANNEISKLDLSINLKSLGAGAFLKNKLESLDIPMSLETKGHGVFFDNGPEQNSNDIKHAPYGGTWNLEGKEWINQDHIKYEDYIFNPLEKTIMQYTGNQTSLIIPKTINGVKVEKIAAFAFHNRKLTQVEFPDSILEIGKSAFAFNKIKNIVLPDSLLVLGDVVFDENRATSLKMSSQIQSIGRQAFRYNQFTEVILPDTLVSLGMQAFINNGPDRKSQSIPTHDFVGKWKLPAGSQVWVKEDSLSESQTLALGKLEAFEAAVSKDLNLKENRNKAKELALPAMNAVIEAFGSDSNPYRLRCDHADQTLRNKVNGYIIEEIKLILGDLPGVETDLVLPDHTHEKLDEVTEITWTSNNQTFISHTGKVTQPGKGMGDVNVTLNVTIRYLNGFRKENIQVTLKELDDSISVNIENISGIPLPVAEQAQKWKSKQQINSQAL